MSVEVCVAIYGGAGPWVWVDPDLVWLDDVLLNSGRG